jgi:DNA end-binding protein Ku
MKPFALLMRALEETGRVAIAKVTLRQKEQLCSLRIYDGTIALETMYYADEVRKTRDLSVPGEDVKIDDRELKMATSIVDMLTGDFDFASYKDEYREALLDVIAKKAEGQTIEAPAPAAAKITDLTEALRASVEEIRKRKKAGADEEEEEAPARSRRAKSA